MNNTDKLFRHFSLHLLESRTIRGISVEAGIPYMTLNRFIKTLRNQDLITSEKVGKSWLCRLNISNPITKQHLILASDAYKRCFLEKMPLIKKLGKIIEARSDKLLAAALFGSYASGKQKKHSDIDIAFIYEKTHDDMKAAFRSIEQIHDVEINTMAFTKKQFIGMLKAKEENIGKQIIKNHVILHNPELFWNMIYGALK